MRAFIGLGSNLGDRETRLKRALEELKSQGIKVIQTSSIYETDAVGPPQPKFLNAVCEVETENSPRGLLTTLKDIERLMGRSQSERWGPREIDLDLLLYEAVTINEDDFTLPHPELTHRAFVMVPLLEIAPHLELPTGEPLSIYSEKDPAGVRMHSSLD